MSRETPTSPEALRADIAQTRAYLSDTATAPATKTDVKVRMGRAAAEASKRLTDQAGRARVKAIDAAHRPVPVAVTSAAATALIVAAVLTRRAHR